MKKMIMIRLLITFVVTLFVGLVAWFIGSGDSRWLIAAAIAMGIQWIVFIPASLYQTERFYDLVGSITFLSVVAFALYIAEVMTFWQSLAAAMVVLWTVRLGTFLFLRVLKAGHDTRFEEIKRSPARFLVAWTLQGAWVFVTLLPTLVILFYGQHLETSAWTIVGALLWVLGFGIEVIADAQKSAFRRQEEKALPFITSGLWRYSRHPNYVGEITLWVGLFVMSVPLLQGSLWLALISPVFVYLLLAKVSGVPMLEAQAKKRWGDREDFQQYAKNTPKLFI